MLWFQKLGPRNGLFVYGSSMLWHYLCDGRSTEADPVYVFSTVSLHQSHSSKFCLYDYIMLLEFMFLFLSLCVLSVF